MDKVYDWMRTNKVMAGIIVATFMLVIINLVLVAQFVNILNSVI